MGEDYVSREWAFQEWEGKAWIRNKNWKLYLNGNLFDMKNDPFEESPITRDNDSAESARIREYFSREMTQLRQS
jgi:hypothetical protein